MGSEQRSALHRIFSNTGFLVSSRIINALCSFAYVAWAAHTLGLKTFGVLLLITTFVMLVSDMTHLQSWQTLLHYGAASYEARDRRRFMPILGYCMRSDMLSGLAGLVGGLIVIAVAGTHFLGWSDAVKRDASWMMLTVAFMNTGWSTGLIRLSNRFGLAALFDFVSTCVRTIGYLIGYLLHASLEFFLFVWFLHQAALFVVTSLGGFILLRRHMGRDIGFFSCLFCAADIVGIWGFTIRVSVNQILDAVFRQGGTLIIGAVLGARDVAIYRVTKQICDGLAKPAQMMIPSLYPEFVRFRDSQNWQALRHVTRRLALVIIGFSVLAVLVALFGGKAILHLMLHDSFAHERLIILLMVCSALLEVCIIPLETLLTVMGRLAIILKYRLAVMVLYFVVLAGLMSVIGVTGAALASVACSVMIFALCLFLAARWISPRWAERYGVV
ncbi:lipopolysaccharide biosynthesis protein [Asaia sp. As-1742]|uniref:lipopolysaccharide biosynthesis protein n=1 Tax=Asaia sp. As-1742 TaxID=2608325 RepID=UPI00141E5B87|nr:lipopolysaccharide biosynthesis protein [Asaia sp. As-1742]NIE81326.1 lipopolysaccharide biosynthesis protein [Asaia sp. As-1742]